MVGFVRRSGRVWATGLCAALVVLVAGCGTQHAAATAPLSEATQAPTAKPSFPECPQVPGVVGPSPCASVGAQQNQQANQTFNSRIPLPAPIAAEAESVTARIRQSLEKLTARQRLQVSAVQSALLAGGMLRTDLWVFGGAPSPGVGFGGFVVITAHSDACAWGTITVKKIELDSGGITREGGCLPSAGGH